MTKIEFVQKLCIAATPAIIAVIGVHLSQQSNKLSVQINNYYLSESKSNSRVELPTQMEKNFPTFKVYY